MKPLVDACENVTHVEGLICWIKIAGRHRFLNISIWVDSKCAVTRYIHESVKIETIVGDDKFLSITILLTLVGIPSALRRPPWIWLERRKLICPLAFLTRMAGKVSKELGFREGRWKMGMLWRWPSYHSLAPRTIGKVLVCLGMASQSNVHALDRQMNFSTLQCCGKVDCVFHFYERY